MTDTPATDDDATLTTPDSAPDTDTATAADVAARPATERHVVLTGATSGIGRAAAEQLAAKGCPLTLVVRNAQLGAKTVEELRTSSANDAIDLVVGDLSRMADVRQVAATLLESGKPIDVLLNNAGIKAGTRTLTPDGFETMLAVNHLAPYLLSELLQPRLAEGHGGRIVNVNSFMHKRGSVDLADLQSENNFSENRTYSTSKLLNLLTTYATARKWESSGVTVNAYNPGFVRTAMTRGGMVGMFSPLVAKSPRLAGEGLVFLAVSPRVEGVSSTYYQATGQQKNSSAESYDEDLQARVVAATNALLSPAPAAV